MKLIEDTMFKCRSVEKYVNENIHAFLMVLNIMLKYERSSSQGFRNTSLNLFRINRINAIYAFTNSLSMHFLLYIIIDILILFICFVFFCS
jgi:hypothetical protein